MSDHHIGLERLDSPRRLSGIAAALFVSLACWATAQAAKPLPSPASRFAATEGDAPDFQRHVSPLLGKLGCNGRACHGAFSGQGGFQLSLFGYDFTLDHAGLKDRVDPESPEESYAIQKATLAIPHEGGRRVEPDSWQYHLLVKWISEGAQGTESPETLKALNVTPSEIQFSRNQQERQLKVIAVWEDGSQEDVTCLCRFETNDDAICKVDTNGLVSSGDAGDTHVIVTYDSAVVAVPVLRPVGKLPPSSKPLAQSRTPIDAAIQAKLDKLGIAPSDLCSDAEFLRRVSLDLAGSLPDVAATKAFLQDSSPDKRQRKVEELLESPGYAAWWTNRLCDWTGCSDDQLRYVNVLSREGWSKDWYAWIHRRVEENVPYDRLVESMILAKGRDDGESYRDYSERMSRWHHQEGGSFADSETLVYFWGRRNFRTAEDRAVGFAYSFLGSRIQCAQCHKHPFDVWTKQDFAAFQQFFERIRYVPRGTNNEEFEALVAEIGLGGLDRAEMLRQGRMLFKEGGTIPFPEIMVQPAPKKGKKPFREGSRGAKLASARLLGGDVVDLTELEDPRTALVDWLREHPSQLFAKAFVNRVWAAYFHRGIVEPPDDLSKGNPPCNEALLEHLTQGFVSSGYDMKWVHREICNSDAYQRSWVANATNQNDERNFSRAVLRRLPAEVAFDALAIATADDREALRLHQELNGRAIANPSPPEGRLKGQDYVLSVFGRSKRDSNCDCDRSSEPSLLQTILIRNDPEIESLLDRRAGWIWDLKWSDPVSATRRSEHERLAWRIASLERLLETSVQLSEEKRMSLEEKFDRLKQQQRQLQKKSPVPVVSLDVEQVIEDAYLRALTRYPTHAERAIARNHLQAAESPVQGVRDLLWALINTKEFLVNH